MADALETLKKTAETLKATIDQMKAAGQDTRAIEDSLKRVEASMGGVATSAANTASKIKTANAEIVGAFGSTESVLGRIAQNVLNVGSGTLSMGQQFQNAFHGTGVDSLIEGFDDLTEMTRDLRGEAINVGSSFGQGFDQIRGSYQSYISSILLAQNSTYESRKEIERHTEVLARMGIGLEDLGRTFQVAGTQQNILSEGFLLAADSGLTSEKVFELMATSMRKMGLSAEDAGRPLVALENIAKDTGLPITELSGKIFETAQEGARLGLTVDAMAPVIKRFTDALGPGFKGLAIKEAADIIGGLEGQINKSNAAFIAMQGGLSRPGAGVAEAQLAFEDAFKNPIEIIKSLQTTISGATGGKIIKFEEARANPELANQFKIQRDLLAQLTNNTDPQSQRTVMSILSDMQSGKQLSAAQNKTLEESLKSGTQKQEDQKSLQDKIGKATVGLLTQISLNTSSMFERLLPSQAQSGFVRMGTEKGMSLEQKGIEMFNQAIEFGAKRLESLPGVKEAKSAVGDVYNRSINAGENAAASIRPSLNYSVPALPGVPMQAAPSPFAGNPMHTLQPGAPSQVQTTKTTEGPGERSAGHITVTFKATDELTRALADSASVSYNRTLHGNG